MNDELFHYGVKGMKWRKGRKNGLVRSNRHSARRSRANLELLDKEYTYTPSKSGQTTNKYEYGDLPSSTYSPYSNAVLELIGHTSRAQGSDMKDSTGVARKNKGRDWLVYQMRQISGGSGRRRQSESRKNQINTVRYTRSNISNTANAVRRVRGREK